MSLRPSVLDECFAVLELSPPVTLDELKASYRKLARQYHPDLNAGCKYAETRFKEVSVAYQTLIDHQKVWSAKPGRSVEQPTPAKSQKGVSDIFSAFAMGLGGRYVKRKS